jgi:hypothetical protein
MKYSWRTGKYYVPGLPAGTVYVDGKKVPNVATIDVENGYVEAYLTDEDGKFVLSDEGHAVFYRKKGEVTFKEKAPGVIKFPPYKEDCNAI